jgi:hypothetical protein
MTAPTPRVPIDRILSLIAVDIPGGSNTYMTLRAEGVPHKVIERKCEDLARRGYIEYGTSPTSAWLTDKGKAYLTERGLPAGYVRPVPTFDG